MWCTSECPAIFVRAFFYILRIFENIYENYSRCSESIQTDTAEWIRLLISFYVIIFLRFNPIKEMAFFSFIFYLYADFLS